LLFAVSGALRRSGSSSIIRWGYDPTDYATAGKSDIPMWTFTNHQ